MEKSLRTSLEMSAGDFGIFLTRPISATLLVVAALIIARLDAQDRRSKPESGAMKR